MASGTAVVAGAGIAGLTAAYQLSKHGFHVTVLEASDRVGGRMTNHRCNGYVIDRGAEFLSDGYSAPGQLRMQTFVGVLALVLRGRDEDADGSVH